MGIQLPQLSQGVELTKAKTVTKIVKIKFMLIFQTFLLKCGKNEVFLAINFYEVHNLSLIHILQTCKKNPVDFITGFENLTSLQGCYSYIIPVNVDWSNDTTMPQKLSKCEVKA